MTEYTSDANITKVIEYYNERIVVAQQHVIACDYELAKIEKIFVPDNNIRLERKLEKIYKNNTECLAFFQKYITNATAKLVDLHLVLETLNCK